jgi:cell wall-associated NlpC family hydrolase
VNDALLYLNAPYVWGGRTPFGIDCSGFVQMVYKMKKIKLLRDASQQASQGEVISLLGEAEPGDLAFFDDAEGKITHVGLLIDRSHIIHCSGKVRIDVLDHEGIYNEAVQKYTHKLRLIRRIV